MRLDQDVATSWASRVPVGSKIKAAARAAWHAYGDAKASGVLGDLAAVLEADAAALKAKRIHPAKDGFSDQVKTWAADLIPW